MNGQAITFKEFMESCLYHPQKGYYTTKEKIFGPEGDFFTSPGTHPLFARALTEALVRCFQSLSGPGPFQLVELGPGEGSLGRDILKRLRERFPEVYGSVEYHAVERGMPWPDAIRGVVFSNEFFDALPVHRVRVVESELKEIYVHTDGPIREREGEVSDSRIFDYMKEGFGEWREGCEYEVNLEMLEVLERLDRHVQKGMVLTFDYGYDWEEYRAMERRHGTLLCYFKHEVVEDPYVNPGRQDMTAHVNFEMMRKAGEALGWVSQPLRTQRDFLMQWGLEEQLLEEEREGLLNPERTGERLAMKSLLMPGGISDTIKVLTQQVRLGKD